MITSLTPGTIQWKIAMTNANKALNFVPLYIKNNKDVLKVLSMMKAKNGRIDNNTLGNPSNT